MESCKGQTTAQFMADHLRSDQLREKLLYLEITGRLYQGISLTYRWSKEIR